MPACTQRMRLAGATIRIGLDPPALQGRVVCDSWLAAKGLHPGSPFRTVGPNTPPFGCSIYKGVRDFVGNGIREVCIPVLRKGLGVETKLLTPVADAPLPRSFSPQIKEYLGCPVPQVEVGLAVKLPYLLVNLRFLVPGQLISGGSCNLLPFLSYSPVRQISSRACEGLRAVLVIEKFRTRSHINESG